MIHTTMQRLSLRARRTKYVYEYIYRWIQNENEREENRQLPAQIYVCTDETK